LAQQGSIIKRHGAWYVRVSEKIIEDGVARRKQLWKWLARVENYPKKSEVLALAQEHIARVNRSVKSSNPGVDIVNYFENVYLPGITGKLGRLDGEGLQRLLAVPH
jgi:hypothetical protein